jgi:hypothetical protein
MEMRKQGEPVHARHIDIREHNIEVMTRMQQGQGRATSVWLDTLLEIADATIVAILGSSANHQARP